MKKLLLGLVILVSIMLLVGCGGVIPPPPDDVPPLALIQEYTGTDVVVRWPDGVVTVFDSTGKTKKIWDEINIILEGSVIFKLTNDSTSQIGIEYQPVDEMFLVGFPQMSNYAFEKCGVMINQTTASDDVYAGALIVSLGIKTEKWTEGFTQEMKTVLYELYHLPVGSSLE